MAVVACGVEVVTPVDQGAPTVVDDRRDGEDRADGRADANAQGDADPIAPGDASAPQDGTTTTKDPLCPVQNDLLACFAFDGNVKDDSPRHLTLTAADNVAFALGREGQAARLTLSPKSNVRMAPDNLNTTSATIEMWVRASSLPSGRACLVDMEGRFGVILESDGSPYCRSIKASKKLVVDKWVHFACVNDGATMTPYVDGTADPGVANVLGTTTTFIGIGQDSPSGNDNLDGMIDNLRIWSVARTPAEIAAAAKR